MGAGKKRGMRGKKTRRETEAEGGRTDRWLHRDIT